MAYRYNEKTGDFEDIPQASRETSTRRTDNPPATAPQSRRASIGDDSSSAGTIIINVLAYALVILLVATCS